MWKKSVISSVLVILLSISLGFAATTGKISGRIVDAETGDPLPGANVVIEGTQQGAATDMDGYYFIINVRPGEYTLKASMIGYQTTTTTNVGVAVDRTTTIDFDLSQQAIEGQEVTIVAERPIVQMDVSSTQTVVSPDAIQNNQYKTISDVMSSQTGIEGFGANAQRPRIRGSSYQDTEFVMDGMGLVDDVSNRPYMKVNLGAVQEVQVITGGFNAEYGNVRSGLINVVTKEGTNRYTGSVDFKYSGPQLKHFGPQMYSDSSPLVLPFISEDYGAFSGTQADGSDNYMFGGWDDYVNNTLQPGDPHYGQSYERLALYLWRHRSASNLAILKQLYDEGKVQGDYSNVDWEEDAVYEYGDQPDWVGEASFGGPVPFTNNKVRFFLSHREEQTAYARTWQYEVYRDRMSTLKLTTNITPSMKLNVNGLYAWQRGTGGGQGVGLAGHITNNPYTERARGFEGDVQRGMGSANKMWYPHCNVPSAQTRYSFGFQLTHQLSPSTFYDITFSHLQTVEEHIMQHRETIKIEGNEWDATHLKYGRLGTEEEIQERIADGEYDWDNWQNYAKLKIGDYWYDEAPWGYGPVNWRDVTGEYRMESCNLRSNTSVFHYYTLKGSITSQVNRFNQIKAGFELGHNNLHVKYKAIDPSVNGGSITTAGYEEKIRPFSGALFVQDKLEFSGLIANVGLRWDWQARDKMITQDGPVDDYETGPYTPVLGTGAINNLDNLNWESYFISRLSPRLGISHPMSENAKIFFNYGHFYRWPSEYDLYNYTFRTTDGNRIRNRGNPRLAPPRTIQYEVGYAHNILDAVELSAVGYYKDISDEFFEARWYPLEGKDTRMDINGRYRDIRGVEIKADARYTRFLSGFVSYNHMIQSTGRYGFDRFYEDPTREPRRVGTGVSQPKARPVIKVNLDFHTPGDWGFRLAGYPVFADLNIGLLHYWRAGETFTWNPDAIPYVEDNIRWRPYQRTDARFKKRLFRKWNIEPEIYIDVFNLFNTKNLSEPGGYNYDTGNFTRVLTGVSSTWAWDEHKWWKNEFVDYMYSLDIDGGDRPGDYRTEDKDYIDMPGFTPWTFLEKRQIFFGVRVNFY